MNREFYADPVLIPYLNRKYQKENNEWNLKINLHQNDIT